MLGYSITDSLILEQTIFTEPMDSINIATHIFFFGVVVVGVITTGWSFIALLFVEITVDHDFRCILMALFSDSMNLT